MFNSKYPIVCAAMNQVSDINLAIAVQKAGAVPSLSLFNYFRNGVIDIPLFRNDLARFKDETNSDTLILSVGGLLLLNDNVMKPFIELGFKHIELFHWLYKEQAWPLIMAKQKLMREQGIQFIFKASTGHMDKVVGYENLMLKGPDGAGRVVEGSATLEEGFEYAKEHFNSNLIVSGGIHCKQQIDDYISRGAKAVALGSLFAVSKESLIADSVKAKIIQSTQADLEMGGTLNFRGLFSSILPNDDINLTNSLRIGLQDPTQGVIYIGKVIDYINEVLTVEQIVQKLVND